MNKDLVQSRFQKNLKTYSDNAKVQAKMAQKLVKFLDKSSYGNILEIGCGTGLLTTNIINEITFNNYLANDIVPECEKYIKKIDGNINFLSGDIETIINELDGTYDLIISNASFQWIENFDGFISNLYKKLNKNGVILYTTFGTENYREIYHILGKSLKYYSATQLKEKLNEYSPAIEEEIHILKFESPKDVLKHIKSTGVNGLERNQWTKTDLKNFENNYSSLCIVPTLTYNPIYVKITK